MTKEDFHAILKKPKNECDGFELHMRHCWDHNKAKSIFEITGLDFSLMLGEEKKESYYLPIPRVIYPRLELPDFE